MSGLAPSPALQLQVAAEPGRGRSVPLPCPCQGLGTLLPLEESSQGLDRRLGSRNGSRLE